MEEEYSPEIITVMDEENVEHTFEVVDELESDSIRYLALVPVYDNSDDIIDDSGELVILKIIVENDEEILSSIDDDDEFEKIADLFETRLSDLFEIEYED